LERRKKKRGKGVRARVFLVGVSPLGGGWGGPAAFYLAMASLSPPSLSFSPFREFLILFREPPNEPLLFSLSLSTMRETKKPLPTSESGGEKGSGRASERRNGATSSTDWHWFLCLFSWSSSSICHLPLLATFPVPLCALLCPDRRKKHSVWLSSKCKGKREKAKEARGR